jgi:hypothetical protein
MIVFAIKRFQFIWKIMRKFNTIEQQRNYNKETAFKNSRHAVAALCVTGLTGACHSGFAQSKEPYLLSPSTAGISEDNRVILNRYDVEVLTKRNKIELDTSGLYHANLRPIKKPLTEAGDQDPETLLQAINEHREVLFSNDPVNRVASDQLEKVTLNNSQINHIESDNNVLYLELSQLDSADVYCEAFSRTEFENMSEEVRKRVWLCAGRSAYAD